MDDYKDLWCDVQSTMRAEGVPEMDACRIADRAVAGYYGALIDQEHHIERKAPHYGRSTEVRHG